MNFCFAQNKDSLVQIVKNQSLNDSTRANTYVELSSLSIQLDDSLAEKYTLEGVEFCKNQNQLLALAKLESNLAAYYSYLNKHEKAILYLKEAEIHAIKHNPKAEILLNVYFLIAQIYLADDQHEKSNVYIEKGLKFIEQNQPKDSSNISYFHYLKGVSCTKKNPNSTDCLIDFFHALNYAVENEAKENITNGIAAFYVENEEMDSVIQWANQSLALALTTNNFSIIGGSYLHLGTAYHGKQLYLKSNDYLFKSLEALKKIDHIVGIKDCYKIMALNFYKLNQYQAAYQYLEKYSHLSDSLNSSERKETLAKLEIEYETFRKDASIKELDLQSSRKSIIIGFILSMIVLILIVLYFLFQRFRSQKKHELLKVQLEESQKSLALEKKAAESELKALKSQMNPHFIFNALNGIQEQFMYGDKRKANEQLENFTWLTRQILQVSGKKKIPLNLEIEILTKYLDLEKMRFHEGFTYSLTLSENIDDDYLQIPPMLIQPFVENAVKHGLLHKKGDKKLNISFEFLENQSVLQIIIEDNGIGRERAEQNKKTSNHESFSTYSVEQRLQLLSQSDDFKAFTYFDLKDEQGNPIGTKVIINIPV